LIQCSFRYQALLESVSHLPSNSQHGYFNMRCCDYVVLKLCQQVFPMSNYSASFFASACRLAQSVPRASLFPSSSSRNNATNGSASAPSVSAIASNPSWQLECRCRYDLSDQYHIGSPTLPSTWHSCPAAPSAPPIAACYLHRVSL
jgi:hypothetical protein